jgi:hypothetical protein
LISNSKQIAPGSKTRLTKTVIMNQSKSDERTTDRELLRLYYGDSGVVDLVLVTWRQIAEINSESC